MEKKYQQFVEFGHTRDDIIHKSNTWYDVVLEESISTNLVETKEFVSLIIVLNCSTLL